MAAATCTARGPKASMYARGRGRRDRRVRRPSDRVHRASARRRPPIQRAARGPGSRARSSPRAGHRSLAAPGSRSRGPRARGSRPRPRGRAHGQSRSSAQPRWRAGRRAARRGTVRSSDRARFGARRRAASLRSPLQRGAALAIGPPNALASCFGCDHNHRRRGVGQAHGPAHVASRDFPTRPRLAVPRGRRRGTRVPVAPALGGLERQRDVEHPCGRPELLAAGSAPPAPLPMPWTAAAGDAAPCASSFWWMSFLAVSTDHPEAAPTAFRPPFCSSTLLPPRVLAERPPRAESAGSAYRIRIRNVEKLVPMQLLRRYWVITDPNGAPALEVRGRRSPRSSRASARTRRAPQRMRRPCTGEMLLRSSWHAGRRARHRRAQHLLVGATSVAIS